MDNHMDNKPNGNRPDKNNPGNQGPNKNHQSILAFLICLLVTLVCLSLFTNMLKDNSSEITYDKFIDMVEKDQVKEVTLPVRNPDNCAEDTAIPISGIEILYESDGG